MSHDPYVYPGTNVLRNLFGIRNPARLRSVEYAATTARMATGPDYPLTADGYRATRRFLFQDIFDWAGDLRTVPLAKGNTAFPPPTFLERSLHDRFRQAALIAFATLDSATFCREAAHHIAELNAMHPFREGNGRTMRVHLQQLARSAGLVFDPARFAPREWMEASIVSFHGDEEPMRHVIAQGILLAHED